MIHYLNRNLLQGVLYEVIQCWPKNYILLKNLKSLILILCLFVSVSTFAQGEYQPIVVTGFVVNEADSEPMPGVHMFIPKAGRGTTTSRDGFFVISTYPGDSIILSSIGFKNHYYRVPVDKYEGYSVIIELVEDTTALEAVEVFPYPTEELFKEAFLALDLPDEQQLQNLRKNLNQQIITELALSLPMDAKLNYRYSTYQDIYRLETRNNIPTLQIFNPFAWARFIKSIKNGDFKKKR